METVCPSLTSYQRSKCRIFTKFGIEVLYRTSNGRAFCKNRKWISSFTLHISWPIGIKFVVADLHLIPLSTGEFR